ncbi:MAG: hypothetical protein ABW133_00350 [Polyangiaceae bacterium]
MRAGFVVGTLLGSVFFATMAHAGNDDEIIVGNRAAMLGGAINATVSDASSTWYNPAGLAADARDKIDVSATAYSLRSYTVPKFISTTTGQAKDGSVTEFVTVPTQIAYVRRIAPNWSLGLGYFAPHVTNYVLREGLGENDPLGSQWQVAATVAEALHTAGAALGSTVWPGVRVGMSLIGGYSTITQSFSLFGAVKNGGVLETLSSGAYFATSTRLTLESGIGVQIDVTPRLTLGMSARTPRMQIYRDTDVSINESFSNADGTYAQAFRPVEGELSFAPLLAGRATLALSYRVASGWVAWEFDVQPGITATDLGVDRKAVANARLGLYQRVHPAVALGFGLFTDRTADPKRIELMSGNGDFYGATAGVEIDTEHQLASQSGPKSLIFSNVFSIRYAHSSGFFGRAVGNPDALNPATGVFEAAPGKLYVHELAFYVGSGLHF